MEFFHDADDYFEQHLDKRAAMNAADAVGGSAPSRTARLEAAAAHELLAREPAARTAHLRPDPSAP
jgi:hypothetical protein